MINLDDPSSTGKKKGRNLLHLLTCSQWHFNPGVCLKFKDRPSFSAVF